MNFEIRCHVTAARETQAIPSLALQIKPTDGGYQPKRFEPNPYIGLACTLGYNFFQGFARSYLARATCNRSVRIRYHCLSAVPAHQMNISPSRSDQPFGLQRRKYLDRRTYIHTYIHTNTGPTTFFPATHQRKSSIFASGAQTAGRIGTG